MNATIGALWGAGGGATTVALVLYEHLAAAGYSLPEFDRSFRRRALGFAIAALFRVLFGSLVGWLLTDAAQVSGPIGALAVGMAAPEILRRLAEAAKTRELPQG